MRLFGYTIEKRATATIKPWYNFWSPSTKVAISEETVTGLSAFYAGIQLRANSLSTPKINILKQEGNRMVNQVNHPVYKLLNQRPNGMMRPFSFRQSMSYNKDVNGNAYAVIFRDSGNNALELIPVRPTYVEVKIVADGPLRGDVVYLINLRDGQGEIAIPARDMFHWIGLTDDGLVGISPIHRLARVFGIAITGDKQTESTFQNNSILSGVLTVQGSLKDPESRNRIKKAWSDNHNGPNAKQGTALLDNGAVYSPIAMSSAASQLLETRQDSALEMARILQVPPHMIGILDRATDNNIEKQGIEFVKYSLNADATKFEQEVWEKLLTTSDQRDHSADFDFRDLERGDSVAVSARQESLYKMGALEPDEARAELKMNPLDNEAGKGTYTPLNTAKTEINDEHYLTTIGLNQAKTREIDAKTKAITPNNNDNGE